MTELRIDDAATAPPVPPAAPNADAWRRALPPLVLLLGAVLVFFFDSFRGMEQIWSRSDTFAHAYVVPPISLWLIWRQRAALALQSPSPQLWLLLPFAGLVLVWLAGQLVSVNAVTQLAATAMLVLSVPLVLGWHVARVILFPLAFLFFAVPIGEFMMAPLMKATADVTIAALRLSGIPVFREGLQFVIPSGSWSVVEACSGVRYLMASFMVGSLFAYLNYNSWRRRLVFGLVSLAVPIVANWARAYMIVMLGHLSGNQLAVGADHLVYGWVFFGVVITIVFMIGARWAEDPIDSGAAAAPPSATPAAAPARRAWAPALAGAVLAAVPLLALKLLDAHGPATAPVLALSAPAAGWRLEPALADAWKPVYKNPSAQLQARAVAADGAAVGVFVAYYRQQDAGRKLVSSDNVIVTSQDKVWNAVDSRQRTVSTPQGELAVRETSLLQIGSAVASERTRMTVWQFYWVNGTLTTSDHVAKLAGAWHRVAGRGDESASVVISAVQDAARPAPAALESFLRANLGMLVQQLDAARASR